MISVDGAVRESPLVGKLADLSSIQTVLTGITLIPLLTLPIIAFFPPVRDIQASLKT
jgi:hypothetical protein